MRNSLLLFAVGILLSAAGIMEYNRENEKLPAGNKKKNPEPAPEPEPQPAPEPEPASE